MQGKRVSQVSIKCKRNSQESMQNKRIKTKEAFLVLKKSTIATCRSNPSHEQQIVTTLRVKSNSQTLAGELDNMDKMLMHTELTVMAGDQESYKISA
jgi:hypothetical protein